MAMTLVTTANIAALLTLAGEHAGHPPVNVWEPGRSATFTLVTTYAMRMAAVFMIAASTIALRLRVNGPGGV
ncbi:MAG: hypothetical protein ACLPYY_16325 [Acidimicrobiales bacterium]